MEKCFMKDFLEEPDPKKSDGIMTEALNYYTCALTNATKGVSSFDLPILYAALRTFQEVIKKHDPTGAEIGEQLLQVSKNCTKAIVVSIPGSGWGGQNSDGD